MQKRFVQRVLVAMALLASATGLTAQESAPAAATVAPVVQTAPAAPAAPAEAAATGAAQSAATPPTAEAAQTAVRLAAEGEGTAGRSAIEELYASLQPGAGTALLQFGYSFLRSGAPAARVLSGDEYVLGPGDSLTLFIWGDPVDIGELPGTAELTVELDGTMFYPPVGSLSVSGLRVSELRGLLQSGLKRKYRSFELALSLRRLRSYPVYVAGFVGDAGTVELSGSASVLEVLLRAGGISKNGSLRRVQLTRSRDGSSTVVDLYDLLVNGGAKPTAVREGDVVFVPPIGDVVAVSGDVKRPGIYEILSERSVGECVGLAGGVLPSARLGSVRLLRFVGDQLTVAEGRLDDSAFLMQQVKTGDLLQIGRVSSIVPNGVVIEGHVQFPGLYAVEMTPTLSRLIAKAGLSPETDMRFAEVERVRADGSPEYATFAPSRVTQGLDDFTLRAGDVVRLFRFGGAPDVDLRRFGDTVVVSGEIRYPGPRAWREGLRLTDILSADDLQHGTDREYGEILRRESGSSSTRVIPFAPGAALSGDPDIPLSPSDVVVFYARWRLDPVQVSGEVDTPASVPFSPGMRLSDALASVRYRGDPAGLKVELVSAVAGDEAPTRPATVYLRDLLVSATAAEDFELRAGDRLVLRSTAPGERAPSVRVLGEVREPGAYPIREGVRLSDALSEAGGYLGSAYPAGLILLRPSTRSQDLLIRTSAAVVASQAGASVSGAQGSSTTGGGEAGAATAAVVTPEAAAAMVALATQRMVLTVPSGLDELRGSPSDVELRDGDLVIVPRVPAHVLVLGAVASQSTQLFAPGKTFRHYLEQAGGVSAFGDLRRAYLIRAGGSVVTNRVGLFSNSILREVPAPGDAVVVPVRRSQPATAVEVTRDVTQILSQVTSTLLAGYTLLERSGLTAP